MNALSMQRPCRPTPSDLTHILCHFPQTFSKFFNLLQSLFFNFCFSSSRTQLSTGEGVREPNSHLDFLLCGLFPKSWGPVLGCIHVMILDHGRKRTKQHHMDDCLALVNKPVGLLTKVYLQYPQSALLSCHQHSCVHFMFYCWQYQVNMGVKACCRIVSLEKRNSGPVF